MEKYIGKQVTVQLVGYSTSYTGRLIKLDHPIGFGVEVPHGDNVQVVSFLFTAVVAWSA